MRHFVAGSVLIAFLGNLSGCGGSTSSSNKKEPILPLPKYSLDEPAGHYFLADAPCLAASDKVQLTGTTIRAWSGPKIVGLDQDISTLQTTASLNGTAIKGTYYDRRYNRTCDGPTPTMSQLACISKFGKEPNYSRLAEEHNHLRVCKDNFEYPKNSYESVALTAAAYIERTFKRLAKVAPDVTIPRIELEVLPIFKTSWPKVITTQGEMQVDSFFTNNMAYITTDDGEAMISIFPEAKTAQEDQARYWESAFAVAHEFGHHFQSLIAKPKKGALTQAIVWDPQLHKVMVQADHLIATADERATLSILSDLWTSIYEASADLFAYYAENMDSSSLVGLKQIGTNRNIAFASFSDNTAKILNTKNIDHLAESSTRCQAPSVLCSAHNIGAIIAHAFDQIAHVSQQVIYGPFDRPDTAQIDERFQMAINWYRTFVTSTAIDEKHAKDPTAFYAAMTYALQSSIETMVGAHRDDWTNEKQAKLEAAVCKKFGELLPAVDKPFNCK